jgi:hypothetical protein
MAHSCIHLRFADADVDAAKESQEEIKERFKPLLTYLKAETSDVARDGQYITLLYGLPLTHIYYQWLFLLALSPVLVPLLRIAMATLLTWSA